MVSILQSLSKTIHLSIVLAVLLFLQKNFEEALFWAEGALEIYGKTLGENHALYAQGLHNIARISHRQNRPTVGPERPGKLEIP